MQERAKEFENNVKQVFIDLEKKMDKAIFPTSKGVKYHTGLQKCYKNRKILKH